MRENIHKYRSKSEPRAWDVRVKQKKKSEKNDETLFEYEYEYSSVFLLIVNTKPQHGL